MDPLSDVLSLLKPRSYVSAGFDAGGDWAIQFGDQHDRIKCYAVIRGACWLAVSGVPDPVRLSAGESFVLPSGRPFRLASDLALPATPASEVFPPARGGGTITFNGGGDFLLVGSRFAVSGDPAGQLLGLMPPIVHIRKEADQAALRWSVEEMMRELREGQPGGVLIAQHLAHMMLVQALRVHLAETRAANGSTASRSDAVGWFAAMADRQLAAAIGALHGDPARRWTLADLADCAGMSRSTFAQKFKDRVGEAPMEYLTRWRMLLAGDRLATADEPVASIAFSLGYESESAFSTAFKRVMGCSPRQFGKEQPRPERHRESALSAE